MLGGVLNLYKPVGITSRALVERVEEIMQVKAGHAGTLDPFARGVVVVCFGKATRLVSFFQELDKVYRARLRFGLATDTYDVTGKLTSFSFQELKRRELLKALSSFKGTFPQRVPPFSACKYRGKPLYEYARRGKHIVRERETTVHDIELLDCREGPLGEAEILVHCSGGTYVRSLAHELGEKLGLGAYVFSLLRERVGEFHLRDSIDVMPEEATKEFLLEHAIPPQRALYFLKEVKVREGEARLFLHGTPFASPLAPGQLGMVKVLYKDTFLGLAYLDSSMFYPRVVLAEPCHVA
jgi:tRNA pseudouridine55 synthase